MKLVLTLVLLLFPVPQSPEQQRLSITRDWNKLAESMDRENGLVDQLNKSMRLSPPWRVLDAREPQKRAKLIDGIVDEHKKRIELLERIKRADAP